LKCGLLSKFSNRFVPRPLVHQGKAYHATQNIPSQYIASERVPAYSNAVKIVCKETDAGAYMTCLVVGQICSNFIVRVHSYMQCSVNGIRAWGLGYAAGNPQLELSWSGNHSRNLRVNAPLRYSNSAKQTGKQGMKTCLIQRFDWERFGTSLSVLCVSPIWCWNKATVEISLLLRQYSGAFRDFLLSNTLVIVFSSRNCQYNPCSLGKYHNMIPSAHDNKMEIKSREDRLSGATDATGNSPRI
jgi:hypothetical protein